eukprot:TRINITY_DN637_c0_g1_i1.p1 TRINITY_DN637_c0_g1~~TRINITY_DN637_c0_g1_i1.p1  ORF type:complete len:388 (-),score=117.82 TRINITY_DN637_c0_g1_i1:30-1193(-)
MVLEATVICLDNSEWMRNGDYLPSRSEAQQDSVNLIAAAKTQQNPESSVAVMTSAGRSPEVLVTLTQDLGKILKAVHEVKLIGQGHFVQALQVAQLALKHRQNKHQHQRIVIFVGTPLQETGDELVRTAKRLKKNNVAVDVINFGEETVNTERLESFINAINTNENSHLITVPPGPHILSDILLSSPIVVGEGGAGGFGAAAAASAAAAAAAAGGGGGNFDFGIDPSLDPELALALRLSMEEERARQARSDDTAGVDGDSAPAPAGGDGDVMMVEDDELQRAIHMSMAAEAASNAAASTPAPAASKPATATTTAPSDGDVDMNEDPELQAALQMSMGQAQAPAPAASSDQDFLNNVLGNLPGVDPNDPRIRSVMEGLNKKDNKDEKK